MYRLRYYISLILMLLCLQGSSQSLFTTGAHIDTASPLDFALGEMVTEYTAPATIGFLPSMYYTVYSSEKQLTDATAIQVHFDNEQQQLSIFMAHEMLQHHPQFIVCGMDGIVHLQGTITTIPYFVGYARLSAGAYIVQVSGIPDHIPFIAKWIKK